MSSVRALRLALGATLALAAVHASNPASAQTYPTKPITLVVPLAAGTGMDTIARLYAEQLGHSLGKPVIVENRPGASMMLATASVAAAPADGYTLLIATSGTFAINPVLYKKINYNPDKDFTPIALYVKSPFVLIVNPALPIRSVPDFIKLAKESATPLTYSTPGVGLMQHLSMEFTKQKFGVELTHVPYRNTPQSITDIAAGHVSVGFAEAGASVPLIRDGKLRALAVSSSSRLAALPDIPPFAEAAGAPGDEGVSLHVFLGPAAAPTGRVEKRGRGKKRGIGGPGLDKPVLRVV